MAAQITELTSADDALGILCEKWSNAPAVLRSKWRPDFTGEFLTNTCRWVKEGELAAALFDDALDRFTFEMILRQCLSAVAREERTGSCLQQSSSTQSLGLPNSDAQLGGNSVSGETTVIYGEGGASYGNAGRRTPITKLSMVVGANPLLDRPRVAGPSGPRLHNFTAHSTPAGSASTAPSTLARIIEAITAFPQISLYPTSSSL